MVCVRQRPGHGSRLYWNRQTWNRTWLKAHQRNSAFLMNWFQKRYSAFVRIEFSTPHGNRLWQDNLAFNEPNLTRLTQHSWIYFYRENSAFQWTRHGNSAFSTTCIYLWWFSIQESNLRTWSSSVSFGETCKLVFFKLLLETDCWWNLWWVSTF